MRRRVWFTLRQFDLIGSLQLGLPCNIQDDTTADTMAPRNLSDADFDQDSLELPPPREETEITSMVYFISKGALIDELKDLLHRQISKKTLSYEQDVLQIDRRMRDKYLAMPSILRVKPMSESYGSPSWMIFNRIKVDILYQKSLCVLHRQHLDSDPRHQYSIDTCVQASTQLLKHQQTLHSEAVLGGQLTGNRWLVTSMHFPDFFLGAIVLGLILCKYDTSRLGGEEAVAEMIKLMHSALVITNGLRGSFHEAARFYTAIEIILRKVEGPQISTIEFNFQDFTGPVMSLPALAPDIGTTENIDIGLQEFQGYLDNAQSINWVCIERVPKRERLLINL